VKSPFVLSVIIIALLLLAAVSLPPTGHSFYLAAAGDIMLGRGVASAHADGSWDQAMAALSPYLTTADLAFANLESPITDAPLLRETYDLRAPTQAALTLSISGLDLLSLANNHMGDSGLAGIEDTIQTLDAIGITPVGPDVTPSIIYIEGVHMAWFAFDDTLQSLEVKSIEKDLADVRSRVDLIIVSIHWGSEGSTLPNPRQRALAMALAEAGADLILGHHPHVLQPVEWIWGAGRGRPTLVAFSLGNALFDQDAPPGARHGALLMITLHRLGVQNACVIPFQIDPMTWNVVPASPLTAESVSRQVRLESCWSYRGPTQ
jgi:poly-gamma-glutamate capsule biosynthesis protein CapA/YwtB (metallophosphatase superfamily)